MCEYGDGIYDKWSDLVMEARSVETQRQKRGQWGTRAIQHNYFCFDSCLNKYQSTNCGIGEDQLNLLKLRSAVVNELGVLRRSDEGSTLGVREK